MTPEQRCKATESRKRGYWRDPEKARYKSRQLQYTRNGQYSAMKSTAKRRKIPCTLTFEEFCALRANDCYYCGHPLPKTNSGLDRINNELGYSAGNVLPCCDRCNRVKDKYLSVDDMLKVVEVLGWSKTKETV